MSSCRQLVLVLGVVAVAVTACAAGNGASETPAAPGTHAASPPPSPSARDGEGAEEPIPPEGISADVWGAILTDLENRAGGATTGVEIVTAAAETWSDGSLGCPEPGQVYTQALVDGFHVVVELRGERYDYRVGHGSDVRFCENP